MENKTKEEIGQGTAMTKEDFAALWKTIRLKVTDTYEVPPEILWVNGSTIGTLGNFSASTGKAKSKKTFNISAIVAAALKNDEVLKYSAKIPDFPICQNTFKILARSRHTIAAKLRQDGEDRRQPGLWSALSPLETSRRPPVSPRDSRSRNAPVIQMTLSPMPSLFPRSTRMPVRV